MCVPVCVCVCVCVRACVCVCVCAACACVREQVAVGWSHCVALAVDGSVLSWGRNDMGQLGSCLHACLRLSCVTVCACV